MADDDKLQSPVVNLEKTDEFDEPRRSGSPGYHEETSAEIAAPMGMGAFETPASQAGMGATGTEEWSQAGLRSNQNTSTNVQENTGRGVGFVALILSILSLFFAPVLLGAAGIVLGFIARARGARGLGSWAIGIGVLSLVVGIFIQPFF